MRQAPVPFGDYLLIGRLAGAQSTWRAVPSGTAGPEVALKRLGPGPSWRGRLPDLLHVNLAAPLAWRVAGGERFVVSQLAGGRSLERLLRNGPMPPAAAAFVVAEAARGVALLHRRAIDGAQLLHRRIGPRTVLVGAAGEVRVCGLEEALAPRPSGALANDDEGALRSPEQVQGQPLDARADVFALGSLLCACCEGGALPPALARCVARACAPSRSARHTTVVLLLDELEAWLREQEPRPGRDRLAELLGASLADETAIDEGAVDDGEPAGASLDRAPGWLSTLRAPDPRDGGLPPAPPEAPPAAEPRAPTRVSRARGSGSLRRRVLLVAGAVAGALLLLGVIGGVGLSHRGRATAGSGWHEPLAAAGTLRGGDAVLAAVDRALCRTVPGAPPRFTIDDERSLAAAAPGPDGRPPREVAASVLRALLAAQAAQTIGAAAPEAAELVAASDPQGLHGLQGLQGLQAQGHEGAGDPGAMSALAVLAHPDDPALRLARLRVLAGDAAAGTDARRPPPLAAVCERAAAARAFVAAAPQSTEAIALAAYLAATPPGESVAVGDLRYSRLSARREGSVLAIRLRCANPSMREQRLQLASARIAGHPGQPVLDPDLDALPADSVREVDVRFAALPDEVFLGAVLRIGGGALAAWSELLP